VSLNEIKTSNHYEKVFTIFIAVSMSLSFISGCFAETVKEAGVPDEVSEVPSYSWDFVPDAADVKVTTDLYGYHIGLFMSLLEIKANSEDGGYKFCLDMSGSSVVDNFEYMYFPEFLSVTKSKGSQLIIDASSAKLGDSGEITYFDPSSGTYYKMPVKIVENLKIGDVYESFYPKADEIIEERPLYICHNGKYYSDSTCYINSIENGFTFYTDKTPESRINRDLTEKFYFPYFVKATINAVGGQFALDSHGALLYAEGPITYFKDGILYKFTLVINGPKELTKDMTIAEKQALMAESKAISAQGVAADIAKIRGEAVDAEPNALPDSAQPNVWYSDNVQTAYEYGIMKGSSDTEFNPDGEISIAETIIIAARIHQNYYTGSSDFAQGTNWYQAYVDYAVECGIVAEGEYVQYTEKATREQFAHILSNALPVEELQQINIVEDGAIPDVEVDSKYSDDIYALYRAGILSGSDAKGSFAPDTNIGRSSVAAIATRLVDTSLRRTITLTNVQ